MHSCLILGCGRSGTSMTAGLLSGANYTFGSHLWRPREANPRGFFEDRNVNDINELLLHQRFPWVRFLPGRIASALGLGPHYRHQLWLAELDEPVEWRVGPLLRRRMKRLTAQSPFAYKDPRFCYTLNAWRGALPTGTRFICVFREPGATAASIVREVATASYLHNLSMSPKKALRLWSAMYRQVLDTHSRDASNWLFVEYDDLLSGDALVPLARFLDTPVNSSFREQSLRRSVSADIELSPSVSELYSRLRHRARVSREQALA